MKTLKEVQNYILELKTVIRQQNYYLLSNDFLLKTLYDPKNCQILENDLKFYERIEHKLLDKIFYKMIKLLKGV
tara:strand:- start:298 stop:519 length:222 start_codon:yes stop_codon:yes gene_type:complete